MIVDREHVYEQWFQWAMRESGGDEPRSREAADAAFAASAGGRDPSEAARAALGLSSPGVAAPPGATANQSPATSPPARSRGLRFVLGVISLLILSTCLSPLVLIGGALLAVLVIAVPPVRAAIRGWKLWNWLPGLSPARSAVAFTVLLLLYSVPWSGVMTAAWVNVATHPLSSPTPNQQQATAPTPSHSPKESPTPSHSPKESPTPSHSPKESPATHPSPSTKTVHLSPSPAAAPPAADPHQPTVANITKSLRDNANVALSSNFDALRVEVPGDGSVAITVKPKSTLDEQDFITKAAGDLLIASKATFGWYTGINSITVQLLSDFTDQYGKTSEDSGATLTISDTSAANFDYGGIQSRAFEDPSVVFCDVDSYVIHPAVWKNIKTKGCMTGPTKFPTSP